MPPAVHARSVKLRRNLRRYYTKTTGPDLEKLKTLSDRAFRFKAVLEIHSGGAYRTGTWFYMSDDQARAMLPWRDNEKFSACRVELREAGYIEFDGRVGPRKAHRYRFLVPERCGKRRTERSGKHRTEHSGDHRTYSPSERKEKEKLVILPDTDGDINNVCSADTQPRPSSSGEEQNTPRFSPEQEKALAIMDFMASAHADEISASRKEFAQHLSRSILNDDVLTKPMLKKLDELWEDYGERIEAYCAIKADVRRRAASAAAREANINRQREEYDTAKDLNHVTAYVFRCHPDRTPRQELEGWPDQEFQDALAAGYIVETKPGMFSPAPRFTGGDQ